MSLKFNCPHCGGEITTQYLKTDETAKCRRCGREVRIPANATVTNESPNYNTPVVDETSTGWKIDTSPSGRFPTLHTLADIIRVVGWVVFGFSVVVGLISGSLFGVSEMVIGGIILLYMLATSEAIKVFLEIEENTRGTKELIERIRSAFAEKKD
ncbi:MAG TPA: hypothetical protein VF369_05620 [candidate division Zixibacteria bacterium]